MSFRLRSSGVVMALVLAACNALTGAADLSTSNSSATAARDAGSSGSGRDDGGTTEPNVRGGDAAVGGSTDAGFEASTRPPDFVDDFGRADGTTIGNGWIEKSDNFSLASGGVVQDNFGDFTNVLLWRPLAEAASDVEVSIDVTYGAAADADPSLFLRIQPSSEAADEIDAYTFYTWDNKTAVIDRLDPSTGFATLASSDLAAPPVTGQTYRFYFRVTGDNPVTLAGSVVASDGTVLATLQTSDGTSKRIASPGRIGLGSGRGRGIRWDNFSRVDLD